MILFPARPRLTVDLAALSFNFVQLKAMAGPAMIAPVIKADAYGVGAEPVLRRLCQDHDVTDAFVAYPDEAKGLALRFPQVIFNILNGFDPGSKNIYSSRIRPVLGSIGHAAGWTATGGGPCGLSIDIGMNRLGLTGEQAVSLAKTSFPSEDVDLIVMHLSDSSDAASSANSRQIDLYRDLSTCLRSDYPNARFSLSASGGLLLHHHSEEMIVRPGISLYGGSPTGDASHSLSTVCELNAPVVGTRSVPKGSAVGYNGRWTAKRDSTIAVVGMGYADGYLRSLGNRGAVIINDQRCPVVGAVSMDLIMVDVTDASDVAEGDIAELFGKRLKLDEVADAAGTIAYEVLTSLGPRVERIYEG